MSRNKIECYIVGDFNINILENSDNTQHFLNLLYSFSYFPVINKPTRVTELSATIMDHIWTNDMNGYKSSGISYNSISDHFPVFSSFSVRNALDHCNKNKLSKRIITDEATSSSISELRDNNWEVELSNMGLDIYMQQFLHLYNKHFPSREYEIKQKHIENHTLRKELVSPLDTEIDYKSFMVSGRLPTGSFVRI